MVRRSRYQGFIEHLAASRGDTLTLSFDDIERVIAGDLPPTAHTRLVFWTHTQERLPRGLHEIGWHAAPASHGGRSHYSAARHPWVLVPVGSIRCSPSSPPTRVTACGSRSSN
jgi:hypothetical protein